MENLLEITGRQVLSIKLNKSNSVYSKGAKLKGTKFNSYSYNGKAFNVREDDAFIELQKNGQLFSATFKPTTYTAEVNVDGELITKTIESLELVGYTSSAQEIGMAKTLNVLNRLAKDAEIETVSDEYLASLEQHS